MGLRARIRRLARRAERDVEVFRCSGCGETFKVPAGTWLAFLARDWTRGVLQRGGDPGVRFQDHETAGAALMEKHHAHGEVIELGKDRSA